MSDSNNWQACETGELQDLRTRLTAAERSASLTRTVSAGGLAAAALAVVATVMFAVGGDSGDASLITCETCYERFDAYQSYLADNAPMPADQVAEVARHLNDCEFCRVKFDKRYPGLLPIGVAAAAPLLLLTTRTRVYRR